MSQAHATSVLVTEDDALINDGIAHQLVRLGYRTAGQAYDGAEAVELVCRTHPELVLMDLQMIDPETGREDTRAGLKAAEAIQRRCPTAVVVLSAHESSDLVRQAVEAGVSGYLVKPAADQDLDRMLMIARARFQELINSRSMAGELERHNEEMRATLARTRSFTGLWHRCAWCNRVRDEHGLYAEIETFIQSRADVSFSHGICPDCFQIKIHSDRYGG